PRLRHPVAPVLLLLRPHDRVEPGVRHPARDPLLHRALRSQARARPAHQVPRRGRGRRVRRPCRGPPGQHSPRPRGARPLADPGLRRKLTPGYTLGCKRRLVSSDYYPVFNRPDVDLETSGIAEVRERSIVAGDGREIEVDAIIFGTGFHVTDALSNTGIVGLDGLKLSDAWREGMTAHLGTSVAGFPN